MDIVQRQTTSSRWFQVKARRYVQQTNRQTGASKTRYPSPTSAWPVSSSNTHIYIRRGARPKSRDYVLVARERRSTNRSAEPWGTASVSSLSTHRSIYTRNKEKKKRRTCLSTQGQRRKSTKYEAVHRPTNEHPSTSTRNSSSRASLGWRERAPHAH